ncbi:hypothetical protein LTR85_003532 [Meristemomyces frigidus]|nr:hypothetical protein LTR85_003532 [Meristemomyces frigidus]
MPNLEVEGATLPYDLFGTGPLLLLIPGAQGCGEVFRPIARPLSTTYTVICWDRRGYSRSRLHGAQQFDRRLERDADDAQLLIQHVAKTAGRSPEAVVFGTSSGAIVAQNLLVWHPECVTLALLHEPPSFTLLPDVHREQGAGLLNHIYGIYRAQGPMAAMEAFTGGLSKGADAEAMKQAMDHSRGDEIRANSLFWFEFELRQYPLSEVDLGALVKEGAKIVPLAGIKSGDGPGVGPTIVIAAAVQKDVARLPGGHVGYVTDAEGFASGLLRILQRN